MSSEKTWITDFAQFRQGHGHEVGAHHSDGAHVRVSRGRSRSGASMFQRRGKPELCVQPAVAATILQSCCSSFCKQASPAVLKCVCK